MNNEDKIRVDLTLPGEETRTFETDFVIAALTDKSQDEESLQLISCGKSNVHALIRAWSKALVSSLKDLTENAKMRSVFYDFAIIELKNTIKAEDPDTVDEKGNLLVNKFLEDFLGDMFKDPVKAKG